MRLRTLLTAAAIALLPVAAQAQTMQKSSCTETDKSLPAAFSGWAEKTELAAAARAKDIGKSKLVIRHAATVTLHRTPDVSYIARPAKPGGSDSYGGLLAFDIQKAGTYQIGLSSGAWIDVVKNKTAVISTGHGHGPDCSSIRKVVDFPLEAGRYALQISANADPAVAVMIWPQP